MTFRPTLLAAAVALILAAPMAARADHSCIEDSECDDGFFCNGPELCRPAAEGHDDHGCLAGEAPFCGKGKVCREDLDRCLAPRCTVNADCNDGKFCNGQEVCLEFGDLSGDARGCKKATSPCGAQICNEETDQCTVQPPNCNRSDVADADGDGVRSTACGGTDCDDGDPARYPGNTEICSVDAHDEDCDPRTFGTRDIDGDGFTDDSCCNEILTPSKTVLVCGGDCNDTVRNINPNSAEVCNLVDDNCANGADEGVSVDLFNDDDGDLHGDFAIAGHRGCPGDSGTALNANDCDDVNPAIQPGAQLCQSDSPSLLICDPVVDPNGNVTSIYRDGGICPDGTACYPQPNGTGLCAMNQVMQPPDGEECLFPCFITPAGACSCGGGDTTGCPIGCFPGPQGCECGPE
jgi:hypothetical protein